MVETRTLLAPLRIVPLASIAPELLHPVAHPALSQVHVFLTPIRLDNLAEELSITAGLGAVVEWTIAVVTLGRPVNATVEFRSLTEPRATLAGTALGLVKAATA